MLKEIKFGRMILIFAALLCWCVGGVSADKTSAADAKNLAPNPGFESGGPGAADDWKGNFDGAVISDETAHTGKRSVKLAGLKKGARGEMATKNPIAVAAGKGYRFNCWFKTARSDNKQVVIRINWHDGDNAVVESDKLVMACPAEGVWSCVEEADVQLHRGKYGGSDKKKYSKYEYVVNPDVLTAPPNARSARIYLTIQDTDTVYFDDVYFVRSD